MSAVLAPEAETSPGLLRKAGSLLLLPSVIVLLAWMIVPLVMTLWFSIQYYNLVDPTATGFAGLDNYRYLVTDPDFWVSLRNTLVLVASVLVVTVGLGTLLAVLFNEPFPGRNVARVLAISPFFVMPTVSALVWKNLMMHPICWRVRRRPAASECSRSIGSRLPLASVIAIVSWSGCRLPC
jgi:sorbitol/mannitol transport system permease protein